MGKVKDTEAACFVDIETGVIRIVLPVKENLSPSEHYMVHLGAIEFLKVTADVFKQMMNAGKNG